MGKEEEPPPNSYHRTTTPPLPLYRYHRTTTLPYENLGSSSLLRELFFWLHFDELLKNIDHIETVGGNPLPRACMAGWTLQISRLNLGFREARPDTPSLHTENSQIWDLQKKLTFLYITKILCKEKPEFLYITKKIPKKNFEIQKLLMIKGFYHEINI